MQGQVGRSPEGFREGTLAPLPRWEARPERSGLGMGARGPIGGRWRVAGFRKGRGTRDQIANIRWIIEKAREFQKNQSHQQFAKAVLGEFREGL